jgi:DNA-directed RNA polymerase subunit RPC12/RpoP
MTYKWHDIEAMMVWVVLGVALIVLGSFLRRPESSEAIWWLVRGAGIVLLVVGIVSIGFSARQAVEMRCPHCGGKIVPRVKSSTSHLYLSKGEEEAVGSAKEATKSPEK